MYARTMPQHSQLKHSRVYRTKHLTSKESASGNALTSNRNKKKKKVLDVSCTFMFFVSRHPAVTASQAIAGAGSSLVPQFLPARHRRDDRGTSLLFSACQSGHAKLTRRTAERNSEARHASPGILPWPVQFPPETAASPAASRPTYASTVFVFLVGGNGKNLKKPALTSSPRARDITAETLRRLSYSLGARPCHARFLSSEAANRAAAPKRTRFNAART